MTAISAASLDVVPHSHSSVISRRAGLGHDVFLVPGAIFCACVPWLLQISDRLAAALLAIHIVTCAFGVVACYTRGLRPMGMVFFVFELSWLGIGPLYQLSHHQLAWDDSGLLRRTDLVDAALGLTAGFTLLAAVVMYRVAAAGQARAAVDRPLPVWEPRRWAPWTYLALLALLTPYVIVTNGGLGSLFSSRDSRTGDLSAAGATVAQGGGPQVALAVILPAALAVVVTHLFIARIRASGRGGGAMSLLDALGLAGALVGMVLFTNPLSNTRFISIAAFGSVALALVRPRTPRAGRWFAGLLGIATLAVYPLSNALSGSTTTDVGQSPLAVFAGKDFDGFQQIVNSLAYVHDRGLGLGRYLLSALLFFVPRSMWTGKATPSAIDVAAHRGYWFTNLSMPIHSEIYLEFGVAGVAVFAVVLGWAWARLDSAWLTRPHGAAALLVPYLALAQLGFIRGPLGSLAPVWLSAVLLLAVGIRRRPAPDPAPQSP